MRHCHFGTGEPLEVGNSSGEGEINSGRQIPVLNKVLGTWLSTNVDSHSAESGSYGILSWFVEPVTSRAEEMRLCRT